MNITPENLAACDPHLDAPTFLRRYGAVLDAYRTELKRAAASLLHAGLADDHPGMRHELRQLLELPVPEDTARGRLNAKRDLHRNSGPAGGRTPSERAFQRALGLNLGGLEVSLGLGHLVRTVFAEYSQVPVSALANLRLPDVDPGRTLGESLTRALQEVLRRYGLPDLGAQVGEAGNLSPWARLSAAPVRYDLSDCLDFTPETARTLAGHLTRDHAEVTRAQHDPEGHGLRQVTRGAFTLSALNGGWLVTLRGRVIGLYPPRTAVLVIARQEYGLLQGPRPCTVTVNGAEALLTVQGESVRTRRVTFLAPLPRLLPIGTGLPHEALVDTETGESYAVSEQDHAAVTAARDALRPA